MSHLTLHLRNESFQAINCTINTDQIHNNQDKTAEPENKHELQNGLVKKLTKHILGYRCENKTVHKWTHMTVHNTVLTIFTAYPGNQNRTDFVYWMGGKYQTNVVCTFIICIRNSCIKQHAKNFLHTHCLKVSTSVQQRTNINN